MENYEIKQKNQELLTELAKHPNGSPEYRDIVAKIVKNNVGLVMFVAKKYFCSQEYPTINDDDLISTAYLGLLNAIKSFNPEKDAFTSYALKCIEGYILHYLKRESKRNFGSLEDNITKENGDELTIKDLLASPVNVEEEFVAEDEKQQQVALLKEHIAKLTPAQRKVLTAKYLSGEVLTDEALAEEFACSFQNIATLEKTGVKNLRKMYHIPETTMTETEKIKTKELLKNLILTELSPCKKKIMLLRFYSTPKKTTAQIAREFDFTKANVQAHITLSYKKLCTLCDSIKNTKHLKSILEFSPEESEKESR